MKILIAGVNGFVGKHVAKEAVNLGHEVSGVSTQENLDPSLEGTVKSYTQADLCLPEQVAGIRLEACDAIINLAGLAAVGPSFKKPELYMRVNVMAHTVVLNALAKLGSSARYIAVSTGAVYGSDQPMPISETGLVLPAGTGSPYAQSKLAMERAVLEDYPELDTVVVRPFNHFGPGQLDNFLVPDLYRKIKGAESSGSTTIKTGPLNKARDYTDVRDVAAAYLALAETESLDGQTLFNVCSGSPKTVKDILTEMQEILSSSIEAVVDQSLIRPHDPDTIVGDSSLLQEVAGWRQRYSFTDTLQDFVSSQ